MTGRPDLDHTSFAVHDAMEVARRLRRHLGAAPILGEVVRVCVVPGEGAAIEPRTVQAHCRDRLAAYKVPKEVVFVATLPKTASGKIKRFMLKEAG